MAAAHVVPSRPLRRTLRASLALSVASAAALAGVLVAPATAAHAASVVDQANEAQMGEGQPLLAGAQQTFTAGASGRLTAVEVHVQSVTADASLTVRVTGPDGLMVGQGSVRSITEGWLSIPLPDGRAVVAGGGYTMHVFPGAGALFASLSVNSGMYAAGELVGQQPGADVLFRTYVEPTVPATPVTFAGQPPTLTVGAAVDFQYDVQGTAPIDVSWSGQMPTGLSLSSSGRLTGTPTLAGTFTLHLVGTNAAGSVGHTSTIVVDPAPVAPTITGSPTATLDVGVAAAPFSYAIAGVPAPAVTTTGAVPPGMTVSSTGVLAGTPTAAGSFSFRVTVTNVAGSASVDSTVVVRRAVQGTIDASLEGGTQAYLVAGAIAQYTATRGGVIDAVAAHVAPGSSTAGLPYRIEVRDTSGATVDTAHFSVTRTGWVTVLLDGGVVARAGEQFTFSLLSSGGGYAQFTFSSTTGFQFDHRVYLDSSRTAPVIADAQQLAVGSATSQVLVSGAPAPAVTVTGALPAGVTIDGTGLLSGTPTEAGSFPITLTASNGVGPAVQRDLTIQVRETRPGAPTGVLVEPRGVGELLVEWQPPIVQGDSAIAQSLVQYRAVGTDAWIDVDATRVLSNGASIAGLTSRVTYEVRVASVNAQGTGAWSDIATGTPQGQAVAPTLSLLLALSESAIVQVTPGDLGGGSLLSYRFETRIAGSEDAFETATASPSIIGYHVTGLENGVAYEVRARAITTAGTGEPSAAVTVTPRTVPGAVSDLQTIGGDGTLAVSWTAPADDGGADVSGYVVEHRVGDGPWIGTGVQVDVAGASAVISGLENGVAVEVRVTPTNVAGPGASATASGLPFAPASAPTELSVAAFDRSVGLAWQAPTSTGGSPVVGYLVEHRVADGAWTSGGVTVTGTSAWIDGLANGVPIEIRVAALNGSVGAAATIATTPFVLAPTITAAGVALEGSTLRPGAPIAIVATDLPVGAQATAFLRLAGSMTPAALVSSRFAAPTGLEAGAALPIEGLPIGEGVVDADGVLSFVATLPADVEDGEYELALFLTDGTGSRSPFVTRFAIEAAPVAPEPETPVDPQPEAPVVPQPEAPAPVAPAPVVAPAAAAAPASAELPRTGADVAGSLLALALLLAAAGVVLVRRRGSRA